MELGQAPGVAVRRTRAAAGTDLHCARACD